MFDCLLHGGPCESHRELERVGYLLSDASPLTTGPQMPKQSVLSLGVRDPDQPHAHRIQILSSDGDSVAAARLYAYIKLEKVN